MHNDTLHLLELCFLSSKSQQGRELPTTAFHREKYVKAWPPQSRLGLGYIEGMGIRWRLATGKGYLILQAEGMRKGKSVHRDMWDTGH